MLTVADKKHSTSGTLTTSNPDIYGPWHGIAKRAEKRRTLPLNTTLETLASAIHGTIVNANPRLAIGPLATDTRHLEPGDVFLALRGEKHDANRFINSAIEKGVKLVITDKRDIPGQYQDVPFLLVEDTSRALLEIAAWYRKEIGVKTICITGSCGKTSTKELVSSIYSTIYRITSTYKNFNNLVGVPITLLNALPGCQWAVLELGMNTPGEIRTLANVTEPEIALVTNVCPAHLQGLGDLEGVAKEKTSLLHSLKNGATAVINLDDPNILRFLDGLKARAIGYSLEGRAHKAMEELVRLVSWRPLGYGIDFEVEVFGKREAFFSGIPGLGNLQNLVSAISVAVAGGIPLEEIRRGISMVRPTPGRLFMQKVGRWVILDDSYNANPSSMKNALSTLAFWSDATFRCGILGDMLELGHHAKAYHRELGSFAANSGLSLLLVAGNYASDVKEGALEAGMDHGKIYTFSNTETLLEWLKKKAKNILPNGAWILVKGSRGMRMERAIEALAG